MLEMILHEEYNDFDYQIFSNNALTSVPYTFKNNMA